MKKGFTLIELLAVIVILAVIAVIAVPIVLNIINDSKENAVLRSADFYLDGVETAIATSVLKGITISDGTYSIMEDGNLCIGTLTEKTCTGDVLKVEMDGEVPSSGTLTIKDGEIEGISLNLSDKTITKNNKGELVLGEYTIKKLNDICEAVKEQLYATNPLEVGYKYECEVKPGTKYNFYVLSKEDGTINLIMDANINVNGEAVIPGETSDSGIVAWYEDQDNTYGPVTAMTYLHNATKTWTNIEPLNYEYKDREYQGITNVYEGYTSFVSNNGVLTITSGSGTRTTIGTSDEPLRARMPIYSATYDEDGKATEKGEVADKTANNAYLYDNLDTQGENPPYGYWTLSTNNEEGPAAWKVLSSGEVYFDAAEYCADASQFGVRPVINLKI